MTSITGYNPNQIIIQPISLLGLYKGALAILILSVSCYVAYIRNKSLRISQEQFQLSQEQFEYTQLQKMEEDIEKRFQEGIKLLGNENEGTRLGGIYILWEIVKDAVCALPYLKNEYIYYYQYQDGTEIKIAPYRLFSTNTIYPDNDPNQSTLKETYLNDEKASVAKQSAYKKAFGLHRQILDILCGYLCTKTNSETYLHQYYPSIAKQRFPNKFAEQYDNSSSELAANKEKPGFEIQILLDLLTKPPQRILNPKERKTDRNHYNIYAEICTTPTQALCYRLNFSHAILNGANLESACLYFSRCDNTRFEYANCNNARFDRSDCTNTSFKNAHFRQVKLIMATCIKTNFEFAQFGLADFRAAYFKTVRFKRPINYNNLMFDGINGTQILGDDFIFPILDGTGNRDYALHHPVDAYSYDNQLNEKFLKNWRISITELNNFIELHKVGIDYNQDEETMHYLYHINTELEKYQSDHDKLWAAFTEEDKTKARRYFINFN